MWTFFTNISKPNFRFIFSNKRASVLELLGFSTNFSENLFTAQHPFNHLIVLYLYAENLVFASSMKMPCDECNTSSFK